MRLTPRLTGICLTSSVALLATQPTLANPTVMTGVRLNPGGNGLEMTLDTKGGSKPQVFAVTNGKSWQADITNARLQLPEGGSFSRQNPAPGIAAVTITPLDNNSVRVTVTGDKTSPVGQVTKRTEQGITISMTPPGASPTQPTGKASVPTTIRTAPAASADPLTTNVLAQAQPPAGTTPLVPNPKVTVDGTPVKPNPTPPFLPRAVPPPVGDIGVAAVDSSPFSIDLGTAERVPRLVVRDAPAREVLALLARAAGLNLAYTDVPGGPSDATGGGGAEGAGSAGITLDIENEPVQDVFNYVLRMLRLEANRVGRTVFVGPRLPDSARNVITRTLRLNQVSAEQASAFLTTQGAETRLTVTRIRVETIGNAPNQRFVEFREPAIISLRAEQGIGPQTLRGLSISSDSRLNSITLIGNPRQVDLATSMLIQLDARKRQVAVNVRVIDVNLSNTARFGTSFSFGLNNTGFINQGGVGIINFGTERSDNTPPPANNVNFNIAPFATGLAADGVGGNPVSLSGTTTPFNMVRSFLAQLQTAVVSGNAKILTDPTIVVQSGETAQVQLTQQVINQSTLTNTVVQGGTSTTSQNVTLIEAGLTLEIRVSQIDDNGFVSMSVSPKITAPGTQIPIGNIPGNFVIPITTRSLTSGLIRIRDNQTLVLSGIIADNERATATKIPILGDLPLLGALFRSTAKTNQRAEVIVLVTPRILDDSDRSTYGYGYQLSPETQRMLNRPSPSFIAPDPAPPSRQ